MSYTAHAHEIAGTLSFAWATDATLGAGYGDLVSVNSDGIATIRFHLEEDHPAVQDATGDGFDPEQAEFFAIVSVYDVTDQFGQPHRGAHQLFGIAKGKVEEASEAEHRARIEAARQELRSGKRERAFTDLDGNLRTR